MVRTCVNVIAPVRQLVPESAQAGPLDEGYPGMRLPGRGGAGGRALMGRIALRGSCRRRLQAKDPFRLRGEQVEVFRAAPDLLGKESAHWHDMPLLPAEMGQRLARYFRSKAFALVGRIDFGMGHDGYLAKLVVLDKRENAAC